MLLFAFPGGSEWFLLVFVFIYLFAFIILLKNIWQRNDLQINTKLGWSIFFVVAPVIALIVYALFGKKQMGT